MDEVSQPQPPTDEAANDAGVRDRLAREVADWSADRSGKVQAGPDASFTVEVKRPAPRSRTAAKRAPKAAVAIAAPAPNKPFSMSYDGVSSREYLEQTLIRRSY